MRPAQQDQPVGLPLDSEQAVPERVAALREPRVPDRPRVLVLLNGDVLERILEERPPGFRVCALQDLRDQSCGLAGRQTMLAD